GGGADCRRISAKDRSDPWRAELARGAPKPARPRSDGHPTEWQGVPDAARQAVERADSSFSRCRGNAGSAHPGLRPDAERAQVRELWTRLLEVGIRDYS